ncbi:probable E3 ubiquitin-protein ligase HERC4 [Anneissia japonica]|uniref:probable E3 ubiquitin-protein ligase HERC4 n=1 Tax=Anneissia japonica TaxID=1529436 RepID=UPI001425AA35|nr:probable E3 ubiquitin-protein ligase HERC4 [Anneissia japonica]
MMASRVLLLNLDVASFCDQQIPAPNGTSKSFLRWLMSSLSKLLHFLLRIIASMLGLEMASNNNPQISRTLSEVPLFRNRKIRQIACGLEQTVYVLGDGTVYIHNNNQGDVIPERMSSLDTFSIVQAACGDGHSVVLSDKGQVLSWGNDSQSLVKIKPRVIHFPSEEFIIQVSCGSRHTLALAKSGKLFAWGDNSSFQLGFSTFSFYTCNVPTEIACLTGLPIKQICCGGDHSLALTFSGAVFGWGCNESGQLLSLIHI